MNHNTLKKIFPLENCKNINKLKYDLEGLWSISHPQSALILSEKIKVFEKMGISLNNILDATGGLGGNTLSFAKFFDKVISVEIDEVRYNYLKNNVENYNYDNITTYQGDFLNILINLKEKVDVVFVDPPWGGPNYKFDNNINVTLSDMELDQVCSIINNYKYEENKVKLVVYKLPYNFNYDKIISKCKNFIKVYDTYHDGNIKYLFINFTN